MFLPRSYNFINCLDMINAEVPKTRWHVRNADQGIFILNQTNQIDTIKHFSFDVEKVCITLYQISEKIKFQIN